ncbi:MAG: hypothetical protein QW797_03510 [Thermoproteota archaeon]
MKAKERDYCFRFAIAIMITVLLSPLVPPIVSQPQGYTFIYQASRAYTGSDWMDVKAVYMKTEDNRLCFYIEYYGVMPNSRDYYRQLFIYMDTDRNVQTGSVSNELGRDYYIYFYLNGDNSTSNAYLRSWNGTSSSWPRIKDLRENMKLAPELSYMEIWVEQQDIGYTSQGMNFYIEAYSGVATPKTELSYTVGSTLKQITVDGDSGDWGAIAPLTTFTSKSINPPELEFSSIYVADDGENLYMRIDTRSAPTASINTGRLVRYSDVYLDTDNNDDTGYGGYGGSEFHASVEFDSNPSKYNYINYFRYTGTGGDNWNWQWVIGDYQSSNFNSVFEFKIPLSHLGIGSGQTVGIHMEESWWYLYRAIPKPVYSVTYPPMSTTTGTVAIVGFFGSETVFLAVVAVAMVAEAVLIVLLMRRVKAPPPPPPA